jgi:hypothetical protein
MNWDFMTEADYELHEREAEARDLLEAEQLKEGETSGEQDE